MTCPLTDQRRLKRLTATDSTQNLVAAYFGSRRGRTDRGQQASADSPDGKAEVQIDLEKRLINSSRDRFFYMEGLTR